jgi:hypothetical protein
MLSILASSFVSKNVLEDTRDLEHLTILVNRFDDVSSELAHLVERGHVCECGVFIKIDFVILNKYLFKRQLFTPGDPLPSIP